MGKSAQRESTDDQDDGGGGRTVDRSADDACRDDDARAGRRQYRHQHWRQEPDQLLEGARIVEDYGYFRVRTRDCKGSTYTYFARRNGKHYIIDVSAKRGRVTNVRRNYDW